MLLRNQTGDTPEGQWETDQYGHDFRVVGGRIEYRPTITTSKGTFYQDVASDMQRKIDEDRQRRMQEERNKPAEPQGNCPFRQMRGCMQTKCKRDCVFYNGTGCMFANGTPAKDTRDNACPFTQVCRDSCALYKNGCTLTSILIGK